MCGACCAEILIFPHLFVFDFMYVPVCVYVCEAEKLVKW
jgi:hypothetical protein